MKVTKEQIQEKIVAVHYVRLGTAVMGQNLITEELVDRLNCTTQCILVLKNGYTIIGKSSCVDPAEYDKGMGEQYAYENAFNKIWELEGYVLANLILEKAETAAMMANFAENNKCEGGGCTI